MSVILPTTLVRLMQYANPTAAIIMATKPRLAKEALPGGGSAKVKPGFASHVLFTNGLQSCSVNICLLCSDVISDKGSGGKQDSEQHMRKLSGIYKFKFRGHQIGQHAKDWQKVLSCLPLAAICTRLSKAPKLCGTSCSTCYCQLLTSLRGSIQSHQSVKGRRARGGVFPSVESIGYISGLCLLYPVPDSMYQLCGNLEIVLQVSRSCLPSVFRVASATSSKLSQIMQKYHQI
jgi:hypothetical protein